LSILIPENIQVLAFLLLPVLLPLCGRKFTQDVPENDSSLGNEETGRPQRAHRLPARFNNQDMECGKNVKRKTKKATFSDCMDRLIVFKSVSCFFIHYS